MNTSRELIEQFKGGVGGTISALRAVVAERGFIDDETQNIVADVFNISRAEVRGIVSFYADLRTSPPARSIIRVSRGGLPGFRVPRADQRARRTPAGQDG